MKEILLKVQTIINPYVWLLFALVIIIFLVILFKEQIKKLFPRINEIVFESQNRKFKVAFNKVVKEVQAQAKDIKKDVETRGVMPEPEQYLETDNLTARDMVLEAWGALKQTIFNSCSALQIAMTPATRLNIAVDRLLKIKVINEDFANPVKQLHALGQEMANNTNLRPTIESALNYKILCDNLVDWMMLHILSPSHGKPVESEPKSSRRATVVGGYHPEPQRGEAAATLVSVDGSLAGKRYKITKDVFKIGRNEDNDICITEDDYVSGNHAFLSYQNGNLFLSDQNSHNGTYLNGKKVAGPLMVRQDDKIGVGNSVFQVT
ncbi:MAG: FHA domain-containing protein [Desulfobulbaceae bacterium]|nr:FHA domain-containing protein [Desulfobulbaceae bacterium]